MIEQLHYATTPKYNFPPIFEHSSFPRRLIELSLTSMSEIRNKCFQPWINLSDPLSEKIEIQEDIEGIIEIYGKDAFSIISPMEPMFDETPIIAIDVSSIRIGETEEGVICAVRGTVIWNERKIYRYLRIGPFPFHITEDNKKEIQGLLEHYQPFGSISKPSFLIELQSRLCSALERWIQMVMSGSASNSIILWDGSLASRASNNSHNVLPNILKTARDNSNIVLSFSKASTIRFLGRKITDLISKQSMPCLLEIDEQMLSISSRNMRLYGKIYVAKLNDKGYPFRVDIDKALPRELQIETVRRLLGNELMFQGYPEALRLAHIFSTFTASDVIGIQRFIARKYGLKIVTLPSIRKALFGPFGTGGAGD
ncbi:MAG: hypothetical protein QXU95_02445 [Candidatus Bathyarchaeia archaeon]